MKSGDDDESLIKRPPSPRPYAIPPAVLQVPRITIELTRRVFEPYLKARVEACCFWYGATDSDDNGDVKAVVIPRQLNHWGCYQISSDAMARISAATKANRWVNLSQLHTHPGHYVEHSRYDDAHVNSRRALSLVLPFYGNWAGQWPQDIGVHEFQIDYWHLLDFDQSARRVVITDTSSVQLIDTR